MKDGRMEGLKDSWGHLCSRLALDMGHWHIFGPMRSHDNPKGLSKFGLSNQMRMVEERYPMTSCPSRVISFSLQIGFSDKISMGECQQASNKLSQPVDRRQDPHPG